MNLEDYCLFLKDLHIKKYSDLYEKTIDANINTFDFSSFKIQDIDEISFRIKFIKMILKRSLYKEFHKLFMIHKRDAKNYDINLKEMKKMVEGNENSLDNIYDYLFPLIPTIMNHTSLINYPNFEIVDSTKNSLIIYHYDELKIISDGQFFGEIDPSIIHNEIMKHSARVIEPIHLGYIDQYLYNDFVNLEFQKLKLKENLFIIDNYVFQSIKSSYFKKKYFQEFHAEEYERGKILFKKGETLNYIYFTKEGEIDLALRINFLELNYIIQTFTLKLRATDMSNNEYKLENGYIII